MKRIVSPVAFATILIPLILSANSTTVKFDTALTNGTEWAYSKVKFTTGANSHVYFDTLGACVYSPEYPFNITEVEITLSCTSKEAARYLQVKPSSGDSQQTKSVEAKEKKEVQHFLFAEEVGVRSFRIQLEGNGQTGNWHIYSAVISGVPVVEPPTGLRASDIRATRFRLSWTNPAGASSNRVDVSSVARRKASGETIEEYDFLAFTNTSVNAQDRLDDDRLLMGYPAFSGEKIYMAGLSTGVVQISSREDRGYLVYDRSRLAADDLTLVVSAKKHSSDTSGTWGLSVAQLDDGGTTNCLALLDLNYEFPSSPFTVPLPDCETPGPLLLFPSDSAKGNRRILIDHLAFVQGYSPEAVETNVVKTAFVADSTTYSVRGLCPRTEYVARITAFDAEGNESDSSEPLLVSTASAELPFTVRIR